jgi:hypothetical protein
MFSFRRRRAAAEASRTTGCSHLDSIQFTELPDDIAGCEECLAIGAWWVHLRMCQSCGHIACCDDSRRDPTEGLCTEVHAPKEADDEHYNAELVGAAC